MESNKNTATPTVEAIKENDEALHEMFKADQDTPLSAEDEQAYRELINGQREAHQATKINVKSAGGEVEEQITVHSIGNKALSGAMAVDSDSWHTEHAKEK